MALLEKKEILYSVRGNRAEWKKLKKALKDARIRGVSSDVWLDEAPACGCGAHLDIRDFGPRGKIDRNWYYIMVADLDSVKAREVLQGLGFPAVEG